MVAASAAPLVDVVLPPEPAQPRAAQGGNPYVAAPRRTRGEDFSARLAASMSHYAARRTRQSPPSVQPAPRSEPAWNPFVFPDQMFASTPRTHGATPWAGGRPGATYASTARQTLPPTPRCLLALGLRQGSTAQQVRQAYRQKARALHPDAGGDAAAFIALRSVYEEALRLAIGQG